ncbi:MAG: single-stranded-DNA-specific exonuclease RecJ [Cyanobacteriota bacterium]|nr:single-stranded-DNA-specific exonuclease RecJ [Cyanobacteriota bacterium]
MSARRWQLPAPLSDPEGFRRGLTHELVEQLPPELTVLLQRRGYSTAEAILELLHPPAAPPARRHFPELEVASERLLRSCQGSEPLAICGDYDADGMTSTALLMGVLGRLGARPVAAIPSRQEDGYGLNRAMVERLAAEGIALLVTVDNGIAAVEALERAAELGVEVIVTDHHSPPEQRPPLLALLHPATTPADSPYRGLAGVGLAYVLAADLCEQLSRDDALRMARDLFCIGTIADMAPLTGVNRLWLREGLPQLGNSALPGLQALIQVAGLSELPVDAQAVGFQIAPRINAVGRLGDPDLVVTLLTSDDRSLALELARECEILNRERRELCQAIEAEALALIEADGGSTPPFLLLAQSHWHHGVIGIVASRLVERFGLPVALLSGEGDGRLRASVRSPAGFAVDQALRSCADLLDRFGGHPAAGGFTVKAERLAELHERLNQLAGVWREAEGAAVTVQPEVLLALERIDRDFWKALQKLEPFGSGHPQPIFWSHGCRVASQKLLRGGHLQLQLSQGDASLRAIAWRWDDSTPVPPLVDVAYRLRSDCWQGEWRLQLELIALRPSLIGASGQGEVVLQRRERTYWCRRQAGGLVIRNAAGEEISHLLEHDRPVSERHPYVEALLRDAALALGLVS